MRQEALPTISLTEHKACDQSRQTAKEALREHADSTISASCKRTPQQHKLRRGCTAQPEASARGRLCISLGLIHRLQSRNIIIYAQRDKATTAALLRVVRVPRRKITRCGRRGCGRREEISEWISGGVRKLLAEGEVLKDGQIRRWIGLEVQVAPLLSRGTLVGTALLTIIAPAPAHGAICHGAPTLQGSELAPAENVATKAHIPLAAIHDVRQSIDVWHRCCL